MSRVENRRRPLVKKVTFTEDEWRLADVFYQRVKRTRGGVLPFATHARDLLLNAHTVTVVVALDPAIVRADMARIGNNINQIAHKANTTGLVTSDDLTRVIDLQGQLIALLRRMCRERDEAIEMAKWR